MGKCVVEGSVNSFVAMSLFVCCFILRVVQRCLEIILRCENTYILMGHEFTSVQNVARYISSSPMVYLT